MTTGNRQTMKQTGIQNSCLEIDFQGRIAHLELPEEDVDCLESTRQCHSRKRTILNEIYLKRYRVLP